MTTEEFEANALNGNITNFEPFYRRRLLQKRHFQTD